jgi:arylsulfatase A-like enzyme
LLTGCYPQRVGITGVLFPGDPKGLHPEEVTIAKVLKDNNYNIALYDPFFHNIPELLEDKYDYIVCCEVIEHFHNPKKEFTLLKKLLKKGAQLYCMTDLYDESNDFHNWYYKNDLTHVFIYHKNTILWIQQEFGFSDVKISGRLISFIH